MTTGTAMLYDKTDHDNRLRTTSLTSVSAALLLSVGSLLALSRMCERSLSDLLHSGRGSLLRGIPELCNCLIRLWNQRFDDGQRLFHTAHSVRYDTALALIAVWVLLTIYLIVMLVRGHLNAALLPSAVIVLLSMLFHKTSLPSVLCLMLGASEALLLTVSGRLDPRRILWLLAGVFCLCVILIVSGQHLNGPHQFKTAVHRQFDLISYGRDTLPGGDLYRADQIHTDSEKLRLCVTSDASKDLYLRGFVGGQYQGGHWQTLPGSAYGGSGSGMFQWLSENGLIPESQYAAYLQDPDKTAQKNKISVNNTGADRRYLYAPYSADRISLRGVHQDRDNGYRLQRLIGMRQYHYFEYAPALPSELLHADNWLTDPATAEEQQYVSAERVYRDFVYEQYGAVDPTLQSLIQTAFHQNEEDETAGIYTIAVKIRQTLETLAVYQKEMDPIPTEVDPIRYFLTVSGSGNEALFASASVMAFRSFGIPARYVEGYLLRADSSQSETTRNLTSDAAHAWCEVYLDGIGWVPVDTTPGFYYDTYTMIHLLDASRQIRRTTATEEREDSAESLLKQQKNPVTVPADLVRKTGRVLYGILVLLLLLLIAVSLLLILTRLLLLAQFHRRLSRASGIQKSFLQSDRIRMMMQSLGVSSAIGWQVQQTEDQLRAVLPAIQPGEYQRMNEILERCCFGHLELRPYEEDIVQRLLEKCIREVTHLPLRTRLHYLVSDTLQLLRYRFLSGFGSRKGVEVL